jgi:hypothetical protein
MQRKAHRLGGVYSIIQKDRSPTNMHELFFSFLVDRCRDGHNSISADFQKPQHVSSKMFFLKRLGKSMKLYSYFLKGTRLPHILDTMCGAFGKRERSANIRSRNSRSSKFVEVQGDEKGRAGALRGFIYVKNLGDELAFGCCRMVETQADGDDDEHQCDIRS